MYNSVHSHLTIHLNCNKQQLYKCDIFRFLLCYILVFTFSFFVIGSSEAVPQLLALSVKLFHKMVDTREPFHLTLLNVCFSNLQAKSSSKSSIASFFTQKFPTTTQVTSQQQVSMYDFPYFRVINCQSCNFH